MPKKDTKFKPGQSGNPAGRPKGSKNRFSQEFVDALAKDFKENGETAIRTLAENSPGEYLRVIASVLPKDINIEQEVRNYVIAAQPEQRPEEWVTSHALSGRPSLDHKPH